MKYSLMSLMIDQEVKIKKPNFIQMIIMRSMGYDGPEPSVEEMFRFLNEHGIPAENGSMTFRDIVRFAKECAFWGTGHPGVPARVQGQRFPAVRAASPVPAIPACTVQGSWKLDSLSGPSSPPARAARAPLS